MLTDNQLNELEPLMHHPRYGKILTCAVETWKNHDVEPMFGMMGFHENLYADIWELCSNEQGIKHCCLIGAAVSGNRKVSKFESPSDTCRMKFELSREEVWDLTWGFDFSGYVGVGNRETREFAGMVRQIVKPN